jgi:hypothetical protein
MCPWTRQRAGNSYLSPTGSACAVAPYHAHLFRVFMLWFCWIFWFCVFDDFLHVFGSVGFFLCHLISNLAIKNPQSLNLLCLILSLPDELLFLRILRWTLSRICFDSFVQTSNLPTKSTRCTTSSELLNKIISNLEHQQYYWQN